MHQRLPSKKITTACAAALTAALWLLPALAQDSLTVLAAPVQSEATEKPVPFNHNEHNKKAKIAKCAGCHHPLPGAPKKAKAMAMERPCSECHKPRPEASDRAPALMMAYHKLCQDCHRTQAKGPVQCSGCHKN